MSFKIQSYQVSRFYYKGTLEDSEKICRKGRTKSLDKSTDLKLLKNVLITIHPVTSKAAEIHFVQKVKD